MPSLTWADSHTSITEVVDPGELTQTAVPAFSAYAVDQVLQSQIDDVGLQDLIPSDYALSGALVALNSTPKVVAAVGKAPKPISPQATVVTAVVVGAALIAYSGEESPPLDPGTAEERRARREAQAWEFQSESSREVTAPGGLGSTPLYTTLTPAEFEERSRRGAEEIIRQLEDEQCRRLGMMCQLRVLEPEGGTGISGPVASAPTTDAPGVAVMTAADGPASPPAEQRPAADGDGEQTAESPPVKARIGGLVDRLKGLWPFGGRPSVGPVVVSPPVSPRVSAVVSESRLALSTDRDRATALLGTLSGDELRAALSELTDSGRQQEPIEVLLRSLTGRNAPINEREQLAVIGELVLRAGTYEPVRYDEATAAVGTYLATLSPERAVEQLRVLTRRNPSWLLSVEYWFPNETVSDAHRAAVAQFAYQAVLSGEIALEGSGGEIASLYLSHYLSQLNDLAAIRTELARIAPRPADLLVLASARGERSLVLRVGLGERLLALDTPRLAEALELQSAGDCIGAALRREGTHVVADLAERLQPIDGALNNLASVVSDSPAALAAIGKLLLRKPDPYVELPSPSQLAVVAQLMTLQRGELARAIRALTPAGASPLETIAEMPREDRIEKATPDRSDVIRFRFALGRIVVDELTSSTARAREVNNVPWYLAFEYLGTLEPTQASAVLGRLINVGGDTVLGVLNYWGDQPATSYDGPERRDLAAAAGEYVVRDFAAGTASERYPVLVAAYLTTASRGAQVDSVLSSLASSSQGAKLEEVLARLPGGSGQTLLAELGSRRAATGTLILGHEAAAVAWLATLGESELRGELARRFNDFRPGPFLRYAGASESSELVFAAFAELSAEGAKPAWPLPSDAIRAVARAHGNDPVFLGKFVAGQPGLTELARAALDLPADSPARTVIANELRARLGRFMPSEVGRLLARPGSSQYTIGRAVRAALDGRIDEGNIHIREGGLAMVVSVAYGERAAIRTGKNIHSVAEPESYEQFVAPLVMTGDTVRDLRVLAEAAYYPGEILAAQRERRVLRPVLAAFVGELTTGPIERDHYLRRLWGAYPQVQKALRAVGMDPSRVTVFAYLRNEIERTADPGLRRQALENFALLPFGVAEGPSAAAAALGAGQLGAPLAADWIAPY